MILIIAGSRGYHRDEYMPKLDEAIRLSGFKPTKIIHGAEMTSVDRLAREWARRNKLPEQGYPADWEGTVARGLPRGRGIRQARVARGQGRGARGRARVEPPHRLFEMTACFPNS